MRSFWLGRNLLQVVAGVLLVVAAGWLITYVADRRKEQMVRPGWVMVRQPGNLQTVALFNNEVWAGGVNGLFRFEQATAKALPLPAGSGEVGAVHELMADRQGKLWMGHQRGVSVYDGTAWQKYQLPAEKETAPVTALLQDDTGGLWFGLPDGVLYAASGRQTFHPLAMGAVDMLYQDKAGRIWAGSSDPRRGGLFCRTGDTWQEYGPAQGLVHPSVTSMLQTQDGRIWIGTGFANAGGANYFTAAGELAALTRQDGLAGDKVRQIYQDQRGNIWFCSEYDGVAVFNGGRRIALLTTADGLAGQEVKKILQDAEGTYWLATDQGLNKISDNF